MENQLRKKRVEIKMKKRIANIVMVFAILLIAFSGVMVVGNVKGWFQKGEKNCFVVEEQIGNASIVRNKIAYSLKKGTILQKEDELETTKDSKLHLQMDGADLVIHENTKLKVTDCSPKGLGFHVTHGEIYIVKNSDEIALDVTFGKNKISWKKDRAALSVDVQDGAQTIHVLAGTVRVDYDEDSADVESGQSFISLEKEDGKTDNFIEDLSVNTLDDFVLNQAVAFHDGEGLCFTKQDILSVLEQRKQEQAKANEEMLSLDKKVIKKGKDKKSKTESSNEDVTASKNPDNFNEENIEGSAKPNKKETADSRDDNRTPEKSSHTGEGNTSNKKEQEHLSTKPNSQTNNKEEPKASQKPQAEPKKSQKPVESKAPQKTEDTSKDETNKQVYSCTISIHCNSILNNMDNLKKEKSSYVPSDGCILATTKVEFTEGETVYDILKRTCDTLNIQMEASYTPLYKSYYVEGIHNLYEFDCGRQSGWMYKVNGWYPNYGCSSYKVKDGDAITWNYTCDGLGADIS